MKVAVKPMLSSVLVGSMVLSPNSLLLIVLSTTVSPVSRIGMMLPLICK